MLLNHHLHHLPPQVSIMLMSELSAIILTLVTFLSIFFHVREQLCLWQINNILVRTLSACYDQLMMSMKYYINILRTGITYSSLPSSP